MIYFAVVKEYKVLKIGLTIDHRSLRARWKNLVCGCPGEMKLFGTVEHTSADINLEIELHKRFDSRRKRGEWFYYDEDMLREIEALPNFVPAPPPPVNWLTPEKVLRIDKDIRRGELTGSEISRKYKISPQMVSNIKTGLRWSEVTGRPRMYQ